LPVSVFILLLVINLPTDTVHHLKKTTKVVILDYYLLNVTAETKQPNEQIYVQNTVMASDLQTDDLCILKDTVPVT